MPRVKPFAYYVCSEKALPVSARKCSELQVRAEVADRVVWNWLVGLLKDDTKLDKGLDAMAARRENELEPKRQRLATLDDLSAQSERRIRNLSSAIADVDNDIALETMKKDIRAHSRDREAYQAEHERITTELAQREMTEAVRADIQRAVDKIRITGVLDKGLYEDKRYLLDALDVRMQLVVRDDGRWLYAECGIKTEGEMLPIELRSSSRMTPNPTRIVVFSAMLPLEGQPVNGI